MVLTTKSSDILYTRVSTVRGEMSRIAPVSSLQAECFRTSPDASKVDIHPAVMIEVRARARTEACSYQREELKRIIALARSVRKRVSAPEQYNTVVEITDAYAHCGLRKYKPYEELRAFMEKGGVARAVLAQHRGEYDHGYIESIVRRYPKQHAGVFLVDMDAARAIDEITRWAGRGFFRGIRVPAETLANRRPLWDWAATLGLHFVIDGDVARMMGALDQFAVDHPSNAMVFTHLAQPRGGHEVFLSLGKRPNVCVQVSGMHSFTKTPYAELIPWIEKLHKSFGPERLLYASNFPVMGDEQTYVTEIELLREGKLGIPGKSVDAVMDTNARRIWFGAKPK